MIPVSPHPAVLAADAGSAFQGKGERLAMTAAFLIGALNPFSIRLVGLMPVSEVVILLFLGWLALFVVLSGWSPFGVEAPRVLLLLLACQAIGLGGYVLSDLLRGSSAGDMMRGWSRMIFLGLDICALAFLLQAAPRVTGALAWGLVAGVLEPLLFGPLFGDWWKFGFGTPLTLALILAGSWLLGPPGAIIALLSAAVAHFYLDFRGMTVLCLCAAGLLSLRWFPRTLRRVLFGAGVLTALLLAPLATRHLIHPSDDRASRSNAERSAMLQAAGEAFLASPLIGYGSWFSNTGVMDEFLEIRKINAQLARVGGFDDTDAETTAIHSQLLVSLAEGGIFGAAFFIVYGLLLVIAIYLAAVELPFQTFLPFVLFFLCHGFFSLLMSPFSGSHRVEIAITAALILQCIAASPRRLLREPGPVGGETASS